MIFSTVMPGSAIRRCSLKKIRSLRSESSPNRPSGSMAGGVIRRWTLASLMKVYCIRMETISSAFGPAMRPPSSASLYFPHRADIGAHELECGLRALAREDFGVQHDRGLLPGIDLVIAGDAHREAFLHGAGRRRLVGHAGVDRLVGVGGQVLGKIDLHHRGVAPGQPALLERLVDRRRVAAAEGADGDLHALQ